MRKPMVLVLFFLTGILPAGMAGVASAGCDAVPQGDVTVTPSETFNPSGKPVDLFIEGRFIQHDGCTFRFARFNVVDEYNEFSLGGGLALEANGSFRKTVTVQGRTDGRDFDGRKLVINVAAVNEAGTGVARDEVVFEHDPHHGGTAGQ